MKKATAYLKRKSFHYFPSLSASHEPVSNVYMFISDVHNGVMPIGGRSYKHPGFSAIFDGREADNKNASELCNSLTEHEAHDPSTLICDVANEIAQHLCWNGWAVYEIIRDTENPQQICLCSFTTDCLYKIATYYIQWVPSADRKVAKKRFIFLPSQDVWEISVPKILGGVRGYRKTLKDLRLSHKLTPDFHLTDMQNRRHTSDFNLVDYVRIKEVHEAAVTRRWGWNRRDQSLKYTTEFFYYYRTITFGWAQAVLREHIIDELNCLFRRVGIDSKIVLSGLPTANEILKKRQDLENGKIQFIEAYNQTSVH